MLKVFELRIYNTPGHSKNRFPFLQDQKNIFVGKQRFELIMYILTNILQVQNLHNGHLCP